MKNKLILLTGLVAVTAFAAPMTAHAQAPVKRLRVMAAPQPWLTNVPSVGFVTAKVPSVALPVQQQWREIPGSGPAVFYQSVNDNKCLRANPSFNVLVSTAAAINSSNSKQQQWIHSGRASSRTSSAGSGPQNRCGASPTSTPVRGRATRPAILRGWRRSG